MAVHRISGLWLALRPIATWSPHVATAVLGALQQKVKASLLAIAIVSHHCGSVPVRHLLTGSSEIDGSVR